MNAGQNPAARGSMARMIKLGAAITAAFLTVALGSVDTAEAKQPAPRFSYTQPCYPTQPCWPSPTCYPTQPCWPSPTCYPTQPCYSANSAVTKHAAKVIKRLRHRNALR